MEQVREGRSTVEGRKRTKKILTVHPSVLVVCMVNDSDIDRAAVLLSVVLMCMNLLTLLSPVTSYRCAVLNLSHRVIASPSLQFSCWSLRL